LDFDTIAARLRIQPNTARSYLKNVLQKTGATRQAELVALLARV
jgi:DNA-binding CsgD family transcriptional regulator